MLAPNNGVYEERRSNFGLWFLVRACSAPVVLLILVIQVVMQTPSTAVKTRRQNQMPSVDMKLTGSASPPTVNAGQEVLFDYTITNQSERAASDVIFVKTLPVGTTFVSSATSNTEDVCSTGSEIHPSSPAGNIYCNLGMIEPNSSISLTVRARVSAFGDGVDTTPISLRSTSTVNSDAVDPNEDDNRVDLLFNAVPSVNKPPFGQITSPNAGSVFVTSQETPVIIPISITATDEDGTVSAVTVWDTGILAGQATRQADGSYAFNFTPTRFGYHILTVGIEDNEGRYSRSPGVQFLLNSPHTLSITKPTGELITPGTPVVVEARSGTAGSRLQKIELYNDGILMGTMRAVSNTGSVYTYRFNWPSVARGRHSLVAILTDLKSAETISETVQFTATIPPAVRLTSPRNEQTFALGESVPLRAEVEDSDGFVRETKFIANGSKIYSSGLPVDSGQVTAEWVSPREGVYSVVAVVTDDLGITTVSAPIKIVVRRAAEPAGKTARSIGSSKNPSKF